MHSKYNETYKNEDSSSKKSFVQKVCFSNVEEKSVYVYMHLFLFKELNRFYHNYNFTKTGSAITYMSKPTLCFEEYQDLVSLLHKLGHEIPFEDVFFLN